MPDLLVRLYDLPDVPPAPALAAGGIVIRRAIPRSATPSPAGSRRPSPRRPGSRSARRRSPRCRSRCGSRPADAALLGFACHDATAKGFFGPTAVAEAERGKGIGEALLFATLRGMREAGYAYAIIGGVGPVDFYRKHLDVVVIPGSDPGIYRGMLRG